MGPMTADATRAFPQPDEYGRFESNADSMLHSQRQSHQGQQKGALENVRTAATRLSECLKSFDLLLQPYDKCGAWRDGEPDEARTKGLLKAAQGIRDETSLLGKAHLKLLHALLTGESNVEG